MMYKLHNTSHLQKFQMNIILVYTSKELPQKTLKWRGKKSLFHAYFQAWKHSIILLGLKLTIESHATLFSSQHEYKPHQCHKWPFPVLPRELEGLFSM